MNADPQMTSEMPLSYLLQDQEIVGANHDEDFEGITVNGLSADSRTLSAGDLYVALAGEKAHGLDYLSDVEASGATALLVDAVDGRSQSLKCELPVVRISSLSQQLGNIASRFHGFPSRQLTVCGVTGTDGKTSVSQFVAKVLQSLGHAAGYIGTIGWGLYLPSGVANDEPLLANPLTTPDPVSLQKMMARLQAEGAEFLVIEVSSHALVQGRVNGVEFDVAVLTNLGRDHLDYHGTVEHYRDAKKMLFKWPQLDAIVVNSDDEFGQSLADDAGMDSDEVSAAQLWRYSSGTEANAELRAENIEARASGLCFDLQCADGSFAVTTSLIGGFNVQNLLACTGVLRSFGFAMDEIVPALSELRPVAGRMELFSSPDSAAVVVDFAHTPQALQSALQALRHHCAGSLWVVFGCGGDRDTGKRALMGKAAATLADHVVVTNDNPRSEDPDIIFEHIMAGVEDRSAVSIIASREEAIGHVLRQAASDDWVLIAGKGHEDYQIIGDQVIDLSDRDIVRRVQKELQR